MMIGKKKALGVLFVILLCLGLIAPTSALAWTAGDTGNNDSEDESSNSKKYLGETSGSTTVKGWFGIFDSSKDPDPEAPEPDINQWINVVIPTNVLFGAMSEQGNDREIFSPEYLIYNKSAYTVKVTPTEFKPDEGDNDDSHFSKTELKLAFNSGPSILLRDTSDKFLGVHLSDTEAVSIGKRSSVNFSIKGTLDESFDYPTTEPYRPSYNLTFAFEAIRDSN